MTGHVMLLAAPHRPFAVNRHLGSWRASCTCRQLDGPERATRDEAVDDHTAHLCVDAGRLADQAAADQLDSDDLLHMDGVSWVRLAQRADVDLAAVWFTPLRACVRMLLDERTV